MKNIKGMSGVIAMAALLSMSAYAGEVLRLQSGNVAVEDQTNQLLMQTFTQANDEVSGAEKYFVIQFKGRVNESVEKALKTQGIEPLRYLPDDAVLVRATTRSAALAKTSISDVRAVASYLPEWKVSNELRLNAAERERVIVASADEAASFQAINQLRSLPGAKVRRIGAKDIVADIRIEQVSEVAAIEGVEWVQRLPLFVTFDLQMQPLDIAGPVANDYSFTGFESGTKPMNFEAAWSRGYAGQGQIVAVADTGLDMGEVATITADFQGNLIKGYAAGLGASSWADPQGHGTHVAGSVLGNGKSSNSELRGGAYKAGLIAEGLWSAVLDNLAPGSDFNKLIGPVYKDGARVHTNSWGAANNFGAYDTYAARVDEYMWNNPEMLILFAAGNSGVDDNKDGRIDENSVSSPGTAKNVLTVGASENYLLTGGIQKPLKQLREGDKKWGVPPLADDKLSDNIEGLAAFSSRGPTNDGRLKPEIVAPGTNIISVASRHPKATKLWGEFNKDYVYAGGTSMATPLTAGAAAVTREYLIKARNITNPSGALVKATLIHTAHDMFPGQYGRGPKQELPTARPNVHEGYGRVDMDYATRLGDETTIVDSAGVATSEQNEITVRVNAGETLHATLSYTDAPAAPAAAKALVNDIDLIVVAPNGQAKQLNDRVNNTEMLEIKNAVAGDYKIIVKGNNVPKGKAGKQPYALLVSHQ